MSDLATVPEYQEAMASTCSPDHIALVDAHIAKHGVPVPPPRDVIDGRIQYLRNSIERRIPGKVPQAVEAELYDEGIKTKHQDPAQEDLTRLKNKIVRSVLEERLRRKVKKQIDKEEAERPSAELTVLTASSIKRVKFEKLFRGRLMRKMFGLMVGPGKHGKGVVSAWIIARLTTGEPFPGDEVGREPMVVMILATEDSKELIRNRLEAAGANLDFIKFIMGPTVIRGGLVMPSRVAFDDDAGALVKIAQQLNAGALWLETTIEHLGDRDGKVRRSTNNEAEVRQALSPLVAAVEAANLYSWGVIHPRKTHKGGIEDSISGSAAFNNVARFVMNVYTDPLDSSKNPERLLFLSANNHLRSDSPGWDAVRFRIESWEQEEDDPRAGFLGFTGRQYEEIWQQIQDRSKPRRDHSVLDAERFLKEMLGTGVITPEELKAKADEADIDWRSVERAKKNLRIESVKKGFPAEVVAWRFPEEEM